MGTFNIRKRERQRSSGQNGQTFSQSKKSKKDWQHIYEKLGFRLNRKAVL